MKNLIKGIGFLLALVAGSAQAIPTLSFNGNVNYNSTTKKLSVMSDLIATTNITPTPTLNGKLNFDTILTSQFSGSGFVAGSFNTISGQNDLTVLDADSNSLLTGNFTSLFLSGLDGATSGSITGSMTANGGTLASLFGTGNLIALQFNLNTNPTLQFNSSIFNSDFSGNIDGRIKAVPEPSIPALIGLGIVFIGLAKRRSIKQQKS